VAVLRPACRRLAAHLRRLPGRTPLRVKLLAALLALVAIALTVISAASVALFRDSQIRHASQQAIVLFQQVQDELASPGLPLRPGYVASLGSYIVILRPPSGQVRVPADVTSLPAVPQSPSWLAANAGRLVSVPATVGSDNWRVITQVVDYRVTNLITNQRITEQATLIVGVDLGDINGAIGRLIDIDIVVSLIIMAALAVAGVAAVRASLRPLTDIEHTAQAIAAGDLSQRVPHSDPRTEVGRLGRALNVMLTQIEAAFQARARSEAAARQSEERMRQFIADASHELRTPLTAIRGYAEYYRQRGGVVNGAASGTAPAGREAAGQAGGGETAAADAGAAQALTPGPGPISAADLSRIMERVEQESARMGVLVEDLLLLARLDQQRPLDLKPVDLLTLAADAVQDARMVAPGRVVDLTVGAGTAFLVLGDEVRLRQVIGNLMSNALTHTPGGTPVHVRLSTGPGAAPFPAAVLEVADEGPGLPPEQARRVFERFYRADAARTRKRGGSGLGLAIVAALVAAHGGTVTLDTSPGRGATFRVTLPLAPEAST
jgi:two-component system OmpR family sensor kinase